MENTQYEARSRFAQRTYLWLLFYLVLALIQWTLVCMIKEVREMFREAANVCIGTFVASIVIFMLFILLPKLRYVQGINSVIGFLIVELQIISLFALIARTWWPDMLVYFLVCSAFLIICLTIGSSCSERFDLTRIVAAMLLCCFILMTISVYFTVCHVQFVGSSHYTFAGLELSITAIVLMLVVFHAQSIKGNNKAQMNLNDHLLASLMLFHEFLLMFALTLYWQTKMTYFTPNEVLGITYGSGSTMGIFDELNDSFESTDSPVEVSNSSTPFVENSDSLSSDDKSSSGDNDFPSGDSNPSSEVEETPGMKAMFSGLESFERYVNYKQKKPSAWSKGTHGGNYILNKLVYLNANR